MRLVLLLVSLIFAMPGSVEAEDPGLVGRWTLAGDGKDAAGSGLDARNRGVEFVEGRPRGAGNSARLDGVRASLEVPAAPALRLGAGDFSVALWMETAAEIDDDPGDLISLFDPDRRVGFQVALRTNTGVTGTQANLRQLQFGIDAGTEPIWEDMGRPGNAVLAFALAVHDGGLYAGTCGNGPDDVGHVYRYEGPGRWVDLGSPDRSNAVTGW